MLEMLEMQEKLGWSRSAVTLHPHPCLPSSPAGRFWRSRFIPGSSCWSILGMVQAGAEQGGLEGHKQITGLEGELARLQ